MKHGTKVDNDFLISKLTFLDKLNIKKSKKDFIVFYANEKRYYGHTITNDLTGNYINSNSDATFRVLEIFKKLI